MARRTEEEINFDAADAADDKAAVREALSGQPPMPKVRPDDSTIVSEATENRPAVHDATPQIAKITQPAAPDSGVQSSHDDNLPPVPPVADDEPPVIPPEEITAEAVDKVITDMEAIKPRGAREEAGFAAIKGHTKKVAAYLKTLLPIKTDLETKVKDLTSKLPTEQQQAHYKQIEEFYRVHNYQNSPDFIQKFEAPITAIAGQALDFIKSIPNLAEVGTFIENNGGPIEFAASRAPLGEEYVNEDRSPMTRADYFEKYVLGNMSPTQLAKFVRITGKVDDIRAARDAELANVKANGEQLEKERLTKHIEGAKREVDEAFAEVAPIAASVGAPIKLLELPANASPEDKKRIEENNAVFKKAEKHFNSKIGLFTMKSYGRALLYESLGEWMVDELKKSTATIAELRAEIQRRKSVGRIVNKQGVAPITEAPAKETVSAPYSEASDRDAVRLGMK